MTNQAINEAIAEHLGWLRPEHPDCMKFKAGWSMPEKWCMDPKGFLRFVHDIPNYASDLSAMHEAEEALSGKEHDRLRSQLWLLIVNASKESERALVERRVYSAKARHRAEAFLRTVEKWKENE